MNYLVSIVTVNLNNLNGLKKTVESVFLQDYPQIEFLIIDGGSTDGSVNFIESNSRTINYWISEKDNGIYDAMNKGISKANGDYLFFLNSGDYLYSNEAISKLIGKGENKDIIFGNLGVYKDSTLEIITFPSKLGRTHFQYGFLPHQATIIRKQLFLKHGFYKTEFQIISDWIFFLDMIVKYKASYRYVNELISIFDLTGISSQQSSRKIIKSEIKYYLKHNYYFTYLYFKIRWIVTYYPYRILKEVGLKFI